MCSLTFFPRILQNEAFRAPSKIRRFQMLDLRKAKTIKGHPRHIIDSNNKWNSGMKKFYHHMAVLPNLDANSNADICLLDMCKKLLTSIYEHFESKIVNEEKPALVRNHENFNVVMRNTSSDVALETVLSAKQFLHGQRKDSGPKCTLSESTLFARTRFKDVLSRIPTQFCSNYLRNHYRDRQVGCSCNTKKKYIVKARSAADLENKINTNHRRDPDRQVKTGEARTCPIGGLKLRSWVTMDKTTEAMIHFMKQTEKCYDVRCGREMKLNLPGKDIREEMNKRPPTCWPPLGPPPILKPPPAPTPPLPPCPRPPSSK